MKPHEIKRLLGDTPYMRVEQAQELTRFIGEHRIRDVLELGFAHGVSTCYIAAALEEAGGGSITTLDLERARSLQPNIDELLDKCGYRDMVRWYYEPSSYNWRLMKFLEEDPTPRFDFCYLDGSHTWVVDGLAFFLADLLMRPGGWILFDDLKFSFSMMEKDVFGQDDWIHAMPHEERETPQVGRIWDLLVKTHPGYDEFRETTGGWWGYAHKRNIPVSGSADAMIKTTYVAAPSRTLSWHSLTSLLRQVLKTLPLSKEK